MEDWGISLSSLQDQNLARSAASYPPLAKGARNGAPTVWLSQRFKGMGHPANFIFTLCKYIRGNTLGMPVRTARAESLLEELEEAEPVKASKGIRSKPNSGTKTNWARLRRLKPEDIRKGVAADPDAHGMDARFWKDAKVVMPTPKEIVTMRLDADLLRWFRREPGYQTRINAILRAYMQAHRSE